MTQVLQRSYSRTKSSRRSQTSVAVRPRKSLCNGVWTRGTSVIPKTSHKDRVYENLRSVECVLKKKDLEKIDALGKAHYRFNNPAENWGVPLYEGLEDSLGEHKKHS